MKYTVIPPCKELKDIISHFWVGTWDMNTKRAHSTYYIIASSLTDITFAFNGDKRHSELLFSAVQGPTHLPNQLPVATFYHLIGVSLHSHAIPGFFNIPSSALSKEFISLDTLLGFQGIVLNEKMALAATTEQRIDILSDYFKSLLKKQKPRDKLIANAIKEIRKCKGEVKIMTLAEDFCLSQKQFKRRFKEFSGFNPKMYARVTRFESAIKSSARLPNLTEVAHANGYYDQAHFIHEFKSFTGFTPTDFWKLSEETS